MSDVLSWIAFNCTHAGFIIKWLKDCTFIHSGVFLKSKQRED